MRTLILSCNTGAGHNSCAMAIKQVLEAHGAECEIADSLLFISETASRFICNWHVRIYRHLPRLFKNGYREVESHASPFQKDSAVYQYLTSGSERMYEYIRGSGFDSVICTHIFPALALTDMLEKHPMPIATAFVGTDYTCSPGTADSALQHYFIPDASLTDEFAACGVPREKIIASGLPVRAAFYAPYDKAAAKRSLGITPERRHILLTCGSMGCGPITELTAQLSYMLPPEDVLTIVCGSNEKLHEKLQLAYLTCPNVHVEGLVTDMPLYMRSADLFMTKPGGLSTTEAAAMGLPMVLIDAVAGCEEHNLDFFVRRGGAVTADTPQALASAALALLDDDAQLARMSQALKTPRPCTPGECIYNVIKTDIENMGK